MAENANYIAVDLGAESGRVMLGRIADGRLTLEQVHRFGNGPVQEQGSLRWDFERLLTEIKTGIGMAAKAADGKVGGHRRRYLGRRFRPARRRRQAPRRTPTTTATAGPTA